jgi:hypothetical protein
MNVILLRNSQRTPRAVSESVPNIFFIVLFIAYTAATTSAAIQLKTDRNGTVCVNLRMILAFEDSPVDVAINLHTISTIDAKIQPPKYYWENYVPYSRTNVSTTTLLEEICVPRNQCYLLQVVDNAKIGWDADEVPASTPTNISRAFSISFDQTIIGIYDSRIVDSCFSVQWYQFGYSCNDETTEDGETIDSGTDSTIISIYRGSLPCRTSSENQANTGNSNETDTPDTSDADETILEGQNVTVSFSESDTSNTPTITPTIALDAPLQLSDSPSMSSAPSNIPSSVPSLSRLPSLIPSDVKSSLNSPIVADAQPSISLSPNAESDTPSVLVLSSSMGPSDLPSHFPSMVPTIYCVDFFMIVQLDEHPEDMVLTLTSTNEVGSEDDVVIWDRVRPWSSDDGVNETYHLHQIVNQTTCIYVDECYTLVVEDMAQDGLTPTEERSSSNDNNGNVSETSFIANDEFPTRGGYYTLSYDTDRIISYYDGNFDGCYHKKIYKFGLSMNCVMTETTEPSDRSCPQVRRRR